MDGKFDKKIEIATIRMESLSLVEPKSSSAFPLIITMNSRQPEDRCDMERRRRQGCYNVKRSLYRNETRGNC